MLALDSLASMCQKSATQGYDSACPRAFREIGSVQLTWNSMQMVSAWMLVSSPLAEGRQVTCRFCGAARLASCKHVGANVSRHVIRTIRCSCDACKTLLLSLEATGK